MSNQSHPFRRTKSNKPGRERNNLSYSEASSHQQAKICLSDENHRIGDARNPERSLPSKEVQFAELGDGSLVEVVEDPEDPERTHLLVAKDGILRYVDRLEDGGQILVPMPRRAPGLAEVKLPTGAISYNSVEELHHVLAKFLSRCVVLPDVYQYVLSSFVLYTWIADRLPDAVYLSVIGLPGSGKTTLLEFLNIVCRRPLLVAEITPAAAYEACDQFCQTLLMDENEWGATRNSRARCHQLRAGTTRNLLAKRLRRTGHCFGPKVLSSLEPPDDPALNSRCIQIPMTEVNQPTLLKPTDSRVTKYAGELQQKLLKFRFDQYKTVKPAVFPGVEKLRPRARDLLSSLAAPSANVSYWRELLLAFFLEMHSPTTTEPLSPAQDVVLGALFCCLHAGSRQEITVVGQLSQLINTLLRSAGERFNLTPRKVGAVLTSLGINSRQRTNQGWRIWLDSDARERVHKLVKLYGSEHITLELVRDGIHNCQLCKETGIVLDRPR